MLRFITLDDLYELRICELTGRQAVTRALSNTGHHVIHDFADVPESHSNRLSSRAGFDDQQHAAEGFVGVRISFQGARNDF